MTTTSAPFPLLRLPWVQQSQPAAPSVHRTRANQTSTRFTHHEEQGKTSVSNSKTLRPVKYYRTQIPRTAKGGGAAGFQN